jgi:hypothetical protein
VVKVNYTNTPKDLFESQNQAVSAVNAAAYSLLSPSDWRVVKSFETGVTQDPKWSAWRQAVRDTANDAITTITMCLTVDELSALTSIQWPHDPDYVAPVEQLPIA